MRKIAIVTNIPAPYRVDLYNYIQNHVKNYEWHIFYGGMPESQGRSWKIEKDKLVNSHFYKIHEIVKKGVNDNRYIQVWSTIGRHLSKLKPDAVISFEYNISAINSLIWCKLHHVKYIHLTDGTLFSERNIGKGQKILRKIIINNSDGYIASSTKAKEKLLSWGAEESKINVALLTTDVEKYSYIKKDRVPGRILYVGSMIRRKGLDNLITALGCVDCDFELHIVGNGTLEEKNNIIEMAKSKQVEDKIVFCGFKEGKDLVSEYLEAKVFVLPTREDCFGLVLVEALSANLPIISSMYADGAYDVIIQGENGFIVNPNDKFQFAQKIEEVLKTDSYEKSCCLVDKSKFKFSYVAQQYVNAVEKVLG